MSRTAAEFAKQFDRMAEALDTEEERALKNAAQHIKNVMLVERNKVTGADGRLSGVGKNGRYLGVRYEFNKATGRVLMRATGPWQLIERATKSAGIIVGRKTANNRRALSRGTAASTALKRLGANLDFAAGKKGAFAGLRPLASKAGGFGPFMKVRDRGTKGQYPWRKGWKKSAAVARRELSKSFINAAHNALK